MQTINLGLICSLTKQSIYITSEMIPCCLCKFDRSKLLGPIASETRPNTSKMLAIQHSKSCGKFYPRPMFKFLVELEHLSHLIAYLEYKEI
jgi:hypothetical protein